MVEAGHQIFNQGIDAITEICFAIFWNAATFPVLLVVPREVANGRYVALTFLLIPLIGIGLVWWALVALARATRFARTYLHLDTMPGRPGTPLRGHISAPQALAGATRSCAYLAMRENLWRLVPQRRSTTRKAGATGTEDIWRNDWPSHVALSRSRLEKSRFPWPSLCRPAIPIVGAAPATSSHGSSRPTPRSRAQTLPLSSKSRSSIREAQHYRLSPFATLAYSARIAPQAPGPSKIARSCS